MCVTYGYIIGLSLAQRNENKAKCYLLFVLSELVEVLLLMDMYVYLWLKFID